MSGIESASSSGLDRIVDQVKQFEACGLAWPPEQSLGEYLRELAELGAISTAIAEQVSALYQNARYGGVPADEPLVAAALTSLGEAVRRLQELPAAERPKPPEPAAQQSARDSDRRREIDDRPRGGGQSFPPPGEIPIPQSAERGLTELAGQTRPSKWGWGASTVLLWTAVVLAGAYLGHESIDQCLKKSGLRLRLGLRVGEYSLKFEQLKQALLRTGSPHRAVPLLTQLAEQVRAEQPELAETLLTEAKLSDESNTQIKDLQEAIGEAASPAEAARLLTRLAELHCAPQRREYAQAIIAYSRACELTPDDANLLNNFAWLLVSADDGWCRDPRRALPLAKRAYELWPDPDVIDTLAHAYSQTGDHARAVDLESEAIACKSRNLRNFLRHRRNFHHALEYTRTRAAEAKKAEAESTATAGAPQER